MEWIEIPALHLKKEGVQFVVLPQKSFCLVYFEDRFVAFSKKCPHAGAPLYQGWRDGSFIVCLFHRQKFDLRTGRGAVGQYNYIDIYPTKEENGRWYVYIRGSLWSRFFHKG